MSARVPQLSIKDPRRTFCKHHFPKVQVALKVFRKKKGTHNALEREYVSRKFCKLIKSSLNYKILNTGILAEEYSNS